MAAYYAVEEEMEDCHREGLFLGSEPYEQQPDDGHFEVEDEPVEEEHLKEEDEEPATQERAQDRFSVATDEAIEVEEPVEMIFLANLGELVVKGNETAHLLETYANMSRELSESVKPHPRLSGRLADSALNVVAEGTLGHVLTRHKLEWHGHMKTALKKLEEEKDALEDMKENLKRIEDKSKFHREILWPALRRSGRAIKWMKRLPKLMKDVEICLRLQAMENAIVID
ncbi:uncharacterized protein LTR77_009024 [Saxophila tyrrhenica]|uniref:Uncharacterized protein n=1 Tax=Saxophila tyrrhenica TaxID=1690608 RepID=A0AAV9P094_9PEZI|nr:hypothetical protein LTR77_009024 [Saxophila tyrrhenica]